MVRTSPFHGGNMGSNPVGITIKKSAKTALFLMVMRRLVKRQGLRQQAESGVTSQVPEAKLARLIRQALRSKTPIRLPLWRAWGHNLNYIFRTYIPS